MSQKTLRELAKEFATGALDKDAYRKARTELLDGIILGEIELETIDFPPPVVPPATESTETKQRSDTAHAAAVTQIGYKPGSKPGSGSEPKSGATAPPEEEPEEEPEEKPGGQKPDFGANLILYGTGAGVIILILVMVLVFTSRGTSEKQADSGLATPSSPGAPETTEPEPMADTGPDAGPDAQPGADINESAKSADADESASAVTVIMDEPPAITPAAGSLIDAFLESKNWSPSHLDQFMLQWGALSEEDRASAAGSGELSQLTNAIYKQIQGEKALSAIDPGSAREKQMKLVEFARQIGIDDYRIKSP